MSLPVPAVLMGASMSLPSASNIIVWSLHGDRLADLYGHTSFIYSLTVVPPLTPDAEPELASVSEDRTLRIWSGGYSQSE